MTTLLEWMIAITHNKEMPKTAKILMNHFVIRRHCWQTQEAIAEDTALSTGTVSNQMRWLYEHKWIADEFRNGRWGVVPIMPTSMPSKYEDGSKYEDSKNEEPQNMKPHPQNMKSKEGETSSSKYETETESKGVIYIKQDQEETKTPPYPPDGGNQSEPPLDFHNFDEFGAREAEPSDPLWGTVELTPVEPVPETAVSLDTYADEWRKCLELIEQFKAKTHIQPRSVTTTRRPRDGIQPYTQHFQECWIRPIASMLAQGNGRTAQVMTQAIREMWQDGLTIGSPRSIEAKFYSVLGRATVTPSHKEQGAAVAALARYSQLKEMLR